MTERLREVPQKIIDDLSSSYKKTRPKAHNVAFAHAFRRLNHLYSLKSLPHNLDGRRKDNMSGPRNSCVRLSRITSRPCS
jgi:hypothetical protein